jgi:hypothetical protein
LSAATPTVFNVDTSTERMQTAQLDLSDFAQSKLAPMVMWGGLLRLAGDAPVLAALAAVDPRSTDTTWRVVWLTNESVIYSEASKQMVNWTGYSQDKEAAEADALAVWARRRSDIALVELTDVSMRRQEWSDGDREWRNGARVVFRDGYVLELPLFPDRPGHQADRERLQSFIEAASDFS